MTTTLAIVPAQRTIDDGIAQLDELMQRAGRIKQEIALATGVGATLHTGIGFLDNLINHALRIRPLDRIENDLKSAINRYMIGILDLAHAAEAEQKCLEDLTAKYNDATAHGWSAAQFFQHVRENTDLTFRVEREDGIEIDFCQVMMQAKLALSPAQQKLQDALYRDWLGQHLKMRTGILSEMQMQCAQGVLEIGHLTQYYVDIAESRGNLTMMQQVLKQQGASIASAYASNTAITMTRMALLKGMSVMEQALNALDRKRDANDCEVASALETLQHNPSASPADPPPYQIVPTSTPALSAGRSEPGTGDNSAYRR